MDTKPLLNLIRAYRKRSAFSQEEVAFLLGAQSGSKISRYEKMTRDPDLETALSLEAIFNCPVAELFPGLFTKVKAAVQERAKVLSQRVLNANSRSLKARKREAISVVIRKRKNDEDSKK